MLIGLDDNGDKITATPQSRAICPTCGTRMVSKCGEIKVWHWSHESIADCDGWSEPETEWHKRWKEYWPIENREVTMIKDYGDGGIIKHRADVQTAEGIVLEFQHSPISPDEIAQREYHYKNMRWVFDVREVFNKQLLFMEKSPQKRQDTFLWLHAKGSWLTSTASPTYLDVNGYLFELLAWQRNDPAKSDPDMPDFGASNMLSEDDAMAKLNELGSIYRRERRGYSGIGNWYKSATFVKRHGGAV